jgi:hypothetical protein
MPILVPVVAGGGGGATLGGGAILGGVTATQVAVAGAVVVSAVVVGTVVNDYLDRPVAQSETDAIIAQAGAVSKAARDQVRDCTNCVWCQINIQAQGTFLQQSDRTAPQGIGPYFVRRTVFAREGVILPG